MMRLCYTAAIIVTVLSYAHARQDFDRRVDSIRFSQRSVIRSAAQSQVEEAQVRGLESSYTFLFPHE